MKIQQLILILFLAGFCTVSAQTSTTLAESKSVKPDTTNTIASEVDDLLNARGKVNWSPMVEHIVSFGDPAVPVLTNRLANGNEGGRLRFCLIVALCGIGTDASLKPIREILQNPSRDQELLTANQFPQESQISIWRQELTTAIREYPTNRESEVLPCLIRLSDPAFQGMVGYYATERLHVMLRRNPAIVGVIIASLDDKRKQFSYNLVEILDRELGNPFIWPPASVSDIPQNPADRSNNFWRGWWQQHKDYYKSETITNSALQTIH